MRTFRGPATRPRRLTLATGIVALLAATSACPTSAQNTVFDTRFEEVRRASVVWDNRDGPGGRGPGRGAVRTVVALGTREACRRHPHDRRRAHALVESRNTDRRVDPELRQARRRLRFCDTRGRLPVSLQRQERGQRLRR